MSEEESKVKESLTSETYSVKHLVTLMNEKGYTRAAARTAITDLFDIITESLKSEKNIRISGFGTLKPSVKPAKEMINPLNKEKIVTKPRLAVRLKLAKNLSAFPQQK